jgi:hypothetical protein
VKEVTVLFIASAVSMVPLVGRNAPYRAALLPWSKLELLDWIEARTLPILCHRRALRQLYVLSRVRRADNRPAIDSLGCRSGRTGRGKSWSDDSAEGKSRHAPDGGRGVRCIGGE